MHRKTILMALAGCLMIMLAMSSLSVAAPPPQKIASLKFSGTLSEADRKYLGLEKPGAIYPPGHQGPVCPDRNHAQHLTPLRGSGTGREPVV